LGLQVGLSLLLTCAVVGAEGAGLLSFQAWHAGAAAGLLLAMLAVVVWRRLRSAPRHLFLHPRHVRELAEVVARAADSTAGTPAPAPVLIPVGRTRLGIQVSAGTITSSAGLIYHYALSHQGGKMTEDSARTLAHLIVRLRHRSGSVELIKGKHNLYHLLVHPETAAEVTP
jgi:hypothetical protein